MGDLIEKLERAEGPSRELDFAILCEIDQRAKKTGPVYSDPHYTASIDAALTLVPEGYFWSITMRGERLGGFHACCVKESPLVWCVGSTPAVALVIAALKAKEAAELARQTAG